MSRHPETGIPAPAKWDSYLRFGFAIGMTPEERDKADAWLAREGVRIVGLEPGAKPYLCLHGRSLAPELEVDSFIALDYRAEELTIDIPD